MGNNDENLHGSGSVPHDLGDIAAGAINPMDEKAARRELVRMGYLPDDAEPKATDYERVMVRDRLMDLMAGLALMDQVDGDEVESAADMMGEKITLLTYMLVETATDDEAERWAAEVVGTHRQNRLARERIAQVKAAKARAGNN